MDDFDLNPDRAIPGDPPINAESMLEVLGESREAFQRRIDAARDMMVPYAIRALLDGADPRRVAWCCGFGAAFEPQVDTYTSELEAMQRSIMGGMFLVEQPRRDSMEAFAAWIGDKLTEFVKERSN